MSNKKIYASVIIPAYNEEKHIKKCIESVKKQDIDFRYEIIVVDDGSKDKTYQIAKKMKIKVIKQENSGPGAARNAGAKIAKGEILCFIDADCIASNTWLKEITRPFLNDLIAGVQGAYKTEQKDILAKIEQAELEKKYMNMIKKQYIDHIGSYSCAYRKKIFLAEGGFDESFYFSSEDVELAYRLSKKGYKLVFNPKAVVWHTHEEDIVKYYKTRFRRALGRSQLHKKHVEKILGDSYVNMNTKIQLLLFYVLVSSLIFSIVYKTFVNVSLLSFIAVILSTFYDSFDLYSKKLLNLREMIVAVIIFFIRIFVHGIGFSLGIIKIILKV